MGQLLDLNQKFSYKKQACYLVLFVKTLEKVQILHLLFLPISNTISDHKYVLKTITTKREIKLC